MFWILLIVIFIILLILFLPIPLKFTLSYSKGICEIKLYKKLIFSNADSFKENKKSKSNNKVSKESPKKLSYRLLIDHLRSNKFKPWIKFNYEMEYSLDDSAITAIAYGLLYNLNPIFIMLLQNFFTIKKFDFNITPKFKDIIEVNINIKSIIYFNVFQILMIFYYTKKSYILSEEVPL